MIHSSPPPPGGMAGGTASESYNVEVMGIPQNSMTALTREMGLGDKDFASLTMAEKSRIVHAFRVRSMPLAGNEDPNHKRGQQDNNPATGPSTGIIPTPGKQGQRGAPQQTAAQQQQLQLQQVPLQQQQLRFRQALAQQQQLQLQRVLALQQQQAVQYLQAQHPQSPNKWDSTSSLEENSLDPSPAAIMGVVPTGSRPGVGGSNGLGGPTSELNRMFNPEFMNNMTSSLEDFAGTDLFRAEPDDDINFERDFGEWFIASDDMGTDRDINFERDFGQRFMTSDDVGTNRDIDFERDFGQWFITSDDMGTDRDIDFERDFGQWFINPDDVGTGPDGGDIDFERDFRQLSIT